MNLRCNYLTKSPAIIEDNVFVAFAKKMLKFIVARILMIKRAVIFELDLEETVKKVDCQIKVSLRLASKNDIESMNKEGVNGGRKVRRVAVEKCGT